MSSAERLRLSSRSVHICIDMQRLFSADGPWPTPWMDRVLPKCAELAALSHDRTIFTRFVPPQTPEIAPGAWRGYYRHWRNTTLDRLDPRLVDLVPPLEGFAPPALIYDKPVYSAFAGHKLATMLREWRADTLVFSGAETDVCVLSTILAAIDLGFYVVVARDAVCSSSDEGHDALIRMFECRFAHQLAIADTEEILGAWRQVFDH
ncbi:cysteine hydrolase family protein [Bosea sp. 2RAB26]|uniref:cysteine hydrolase family protein n=1 Tax=Bosea sp. 2RAB26 TaxID=3237476 RepID=UPI003F92992F